MRRHIPMDNDDRQIGRILSRREVLKLLGATGTLMLMGCGPSQTGSGATTPGSTASTTTPTLNAEARTAEVLPQNPTAITAGAEAATPVSANTAVATGNGVAAPACVVRPEAT